MPRIDGTGPRGFGPMTGRGLGPCGSGNARGFGRGRGLGRFGVDRFISPKNELASLDEEEKALIEELEIVRNEKSALKDQK